MFCENCGARMSDNDIFCQNCGKKIQIYTSVNSKDESTLDQSAPIENIPVQNVPVSPTIPQEQQTVNNTNETKQPSTQTAVVEKPTNNPNPYAQYQANKSSVSPFVHPGQQPVNNPNPYAQYQMNNSTIPPQGNQQFGYTAPQKNKSGFKLNKKIVIISSAIAAVVITGIIVLCVCIANANNPVNKMINAINDGDYKAATELYYSNYGVLDGNEDIKNLLQEKVDAIKKDFKDGNIDYETAKDKLDKLYNFPMIYSTDIGEARSYLYDLNQSTEYLKQADEYFNKKNYENAIYYYDKISKDDKNYQVAQTQRAKAIDGIRQKYLDNAKDYIKSNNYYSAIKALQYGLENDYLENDDKLNKQIEAYINEVISKSDEMFKNGEYSDSLKLLENLKSSLGEDDKYYSKLDVQYEKLNKEVPATLKEIDINESDYFYRYQSGSKDVLGNVYDDDNVCTLDTSKYSAGKSHVDIYVKDYKKVMGTLAVKNNSSDTTAYIEIVGDNKVLYKSETFNKKSKPVTFEVDITDVEWLKIKLTYVNSKSNFGSIDIILSNVEFYKIGSSVPDAPKSPEPVSSAPESSKEESSKNESSSETSKNNENSKVESSKTETTSKPTE